MKTHENSGGGPEFLVGVRILELSGFRVLEFGNRNFLGKGKAPIRRSGRCVREF